MTSKWKEFLKLEVHGLFNWKEREFQVELLLEREHLLKLNQAIQQEFK